MTKFYQSLTPSQLQNSVSQILARRMIAAGDTFYIDLAQPLDSIRHGFLYHFFTEAIRRMDGNINYSKMLHEKLVVNLTIESSFLCG